MLVRSISFPIPLTTIEDIHDDNIDVFVTLEDGFDYTVVVATYKNILSLMDKDKVNFLEPGCPCIIVRKLTMKVIQEAIKAYAEEDDAYWLKLHHFAADIDNEVFDKLQKNQIEDNLIDEN